MLNAAVLWTIPLNREDWLERAHSTSSGDFVRSFASAKFGRDYEKAWSYFRVDAEFFDKKLDQFASWGVSVYRNATSADLKEASTARRDIVVVAHWKDESVLTDDVGDSDHVRQSARLLVPELELNSASRGMCATEVAKALNDYVVSALRWTPEGRPTFDSIQVCIARRDMLNNVAGLAVGNRVEMWDLMLTRSDFAALLHRSQLRTLWLAICSSNYLLEAIRQSNPDAICLASRDTVRVDVMVLKLAAALQICRFEGKPLWRCLAVVGDMFDQMGKR